MLKRKLLLSYLVEFICSFIASLALLKIIYIINNDSSNFYGWLFLLNFALLLLIYIIYKAFKNHKSEVHNLFLALMIPIGMLYLIFMLPGQVPDEDAHYYRVYEISCGRFNINVRPEDKAPQSIVPAKLQELVHITNYSDFFSSINDKTDYKNEVKVKSLAETNFSLLYTLPALMFFIARILNLNIILALYLARLANFLLFLISGYYSIKLIPFGKILLMTYLFIPMVVHQAVSVSADAFINSLVVFFISFTLSLYFRKKEINKTEKWILYICCCFMAFSKIIYLFIVFIPLILCFKNKESNKKCSIIKKIFCKETKFIWYGILTCIFIAVIWGLIINTSIGSYDEHADEIGSALSIFIDTMKKPIANIKLYFNTIENNGSYYLKTFLGSQLGWLNIHVNEIIIWLYSILLILSPFLEKQKVTLNKRQKILFITIFFIIYGLIFTTMYIYNNVAIYYGQDMKYILGVQGRYFIPITIMLLLCLCDRDKYLKLKKFNLFYFTLCFVNILVIGAIVKFFI